MRVKVLNMYAMNSCLNSGNSDSEVCQVPFVEHKLGARKTEITRV